MVRPKRDGRDIGERSDAVLRTAMPAMTVFLTAAKTANAGRRSPPALYLDDRPGPRRSRRGVGILKASSSDSRTQNAPSTTAPTKVSAANAARTFSFKAMSTGPPPWLLPMEKVYQTWGRPKTTKHAAAQCGDRTDVPD